MSFSQQPPNSIAIAFCCWLRRFPLKLRGQMLIDIAAFCWALWLCSNDQYLTRLHSYLQRDILDQELVNSILRGREK